MPPGQDVFMKQNAPLARFFVKRMPQAKLIQENVLHGCLNTYICILQRCMLV